jgi:predicted alpha/beta hydrolase family esterase
VQALGEAWGAKFVDYGERGHINSESGLGDWAEGHGWLQELSEREM